MNAANETALLHGLRSHAQGCFVPYEMSGEGMSSGVGAHGFEVARQRRHGDRELCSRMRGQLAVMSVLAQERLLNFNTRRTFAGKRTCPVDLKALSADRTTHIAIAFGGLTEDLHRLYEPRRWNL